MMDLKEEMGVFPNDYILGFQGNSINLFFPLVYDIGVPKILHIYVTQS